MCHIAASGYERWEAPASTPSSPIVEYWLTHNFVKVQDFCDVSPGLLMFRDIMKIILIYLGNYYLHKRESNLWSQVHSLHMTWRNKWSSYNFQKEKRPHNANMHSSWQFTVYRALLQANVTVYRVEHPHLGSHRKYRVIHKSLRNFWTRLRNNQERHSRKEHINR